MIGLQPRQVEPRALRRWFLEGLKIILRRPLLWAVLVVLCSITIPFLALSLVGLSFASVAAYLLFITIAHAIDETDRSSDRSLAVSMRQAMPVTLAYGALVALVYAVIGATMGNSSQFWYDPDRPPGLIEGVYTRVFWASFGFGGVVLIGAFFTQWCPSPFVYHLKTLARSDWSVAVKLSRDAHRLNESSVGMLVALSCFVGFLTVPFPPVAPLIACIWAAMSYAAYRDIFLGIAERQVEENRSNAAIIAARAQGTEFATLKLRARRWTSPASLYAVRTREP